MKKLLLVAAFAAALCACNNAKTFTLTGTTDGQEQEMMLLSVFSGDTLSVATVTDGKFTMSVDATEPTIARLVSGDRNLASPVFVEVGKAVFTKTGDQVPSLTGTPSNDKMKAYSDTMNDLMTRYRSAQTDEERQAVAAQADSMDNVEGNYDNLFGLYMFQNDSYGMSADEIVATADKFAPELQQQKILTDLRERADAIRKTEVGQPYINIVLPDKDGNNVDLSTLVGEGKYVLIDFWASWCGPCMGEVPYLVKDYAAFHDKGFEIYGVSLDADRDKWLGAVESNEMNWIHVSVLKGWDNDFAKAYAVSGIPANFLIGPDGTIVAKGLRGDAVSEKLTELLGEAEAAE